MAKKIAVSAPLRCFSYAGVWHYRPSCICFGCKRETAFKAETYDQTLARLTADANRAGLLPWNTKGAV